MEDAVDALKMAFSVFIFIIALSIIFAMISQAKEVSDIVLNRRDNTYFAEYVEPNKTSDGEIDEDGRIVGIESVIPTLYTYADGKISVEIVNNTDLKELFDLQVERQYREETQKENDTYDGYYTIPYNKKYSDLYGNSKDIIWLTYSKNDIDLRISAFIGGIDQTINGDKYKSNINIKNIYLRNKTFRENFIERNDYSGKRIVYEDGSIIDLSKGTKKLYVTYTYK